PRGARLLVDRDGGGDVLKGRSAAIEDRDFIAPRPTRPPARYDIAELRVYAFASHEAGGEGVLQLANLGTLLEDVHDQRRRRADCEARVALVLPAFIGPDRSDEGPRREAARHDIGAAGRRARDADVALPKCGTQVFDSVNAEAESRRCAGGGFLGSGVISI